MAIMDRIRCPDQCAPRALRAELNSILMVVGAVLALASSARAATFVVNSTVDAIDAVPGNGVCETAPGNGVCTLRAAIQETNVLAGADTVTVPAGIYALTLNTGTDEDRGDLDIEGNLNLIGAGTGDTILDGLGLDSVIEVFPGVTATIRSARPSATSGCCATWSISP